MSGIVRCRAGASRGGANSGNRRPDGSGSLPRERAGTGGGRSMASGDPSRRRQISRRRLGTRPRSEPGVDGAGAPEEEADGVVAPQRLALGGRIVRRQRQRLGRELISPRTRSGARLVASTCTAGEQPARSRPAEPAPQDVSAIVEEQQLPPRPEAPCDPLRRGRSGAGSRTTARRRPSAPPKDRQAALGRSRPRHRRNDRRHRRRGRERAASYRRRRGPSGSGAERPREQERTRRSPLAPRPTSRVAERAMIPARARKPSPPCSTPRLTKDRCTIVCLIPPACAAARLASGGRFPER